jgi:hypothetical protein
VSRPMPRVLRQGVVQVEQALLGDIS